MMMFKLNQNGLDVRKDEYGRLAATIKCSECGAQGATPIKSVAQAAAEDFINKKFRELGWEVSRNHRTDVCPTCIAARRKPKLVVVTPDDELDAELDQFLGAEIPTPEPVKETPVLEATTETPEVQTAEAAPGTFLRLTRKQEFVILEEMKKVIVPAEEEGFVKYSTNETDEMFTARMQKLVPGVKTNHIRNLRSEIFGNLRAFRAPKQKSEDRIDALEKRVEQLEQMVLELTTK